jgi:DNA-binding Lrp family transcriptional regulator
MAAISETDKEILNMIQLDFPIDARPFQVLAKKLGLSEEDLIARVQAMKDSLIIRRIGGNFKHPCCRQV